MPRRTREQAERTRLDLVRAARKLFERRGFDAVSAEEVAAAAGVTRGALYHHFDGKEGVFAAVVEDAMIDAKGRLAAAAATARGPGEALERGMGAFLAMCAEPSYRRVLLVDGPAVLGWHAWRALDLRHGLGLLRQGLAAAAAAPRGSALDVEAASHLLAGALIDGAMLIGGAPRDGALRRRVEATLRRLVRGLVEPLPTTSRRPAARRRGFRSTTRR